MKLRKPTQYYYRAFAVLVKHISAVCRERATRLCGSACGAPASPRTWDIWPAKFVSLGGNYYVEDFFDRMSVVGVGRLAGVFPPNRIHMPMI